MPLATLLRETEFEADTTAVLTEAFDQAWARIEASGAGLGGTSQVAAARLTIARRIVEIAQTGERNVNRLVEDALSYFASSS